MLDGSSILITGGTGSFGHKLVATLLGKFSPKRVIVFSRDELKQFDMAQRFNDPCMRYFLGDVRDYDRLMQAFRGVDIVFHAAALKQVPAAEYNPSENVKTNIYGAENVTRAALETGVSKVIALSTDKAANPINLYGATKLVSDKIFVAANNVAGGLKTRFSVVRYGNVVGSRGSVVPYFKQLIKEGATWLPITHPDMTRFWISLAEGVQLVVNSLERMHGGEIFIPKLPSVRIVDIATAMAPNLEQRVIGVRPGEKIHETLCPADDSHHTLMFDDHFVIKPTISLINDEIDFSIDGKGERGVAVPQNFSYESGGNSKFLTIDEINAYNVGIE